MLSSVWAWWYVVYLVGFKGVELMEYQGVGKQWKTMSLAGKIHHVLWMYFLLEKRGLFPANYVTSDVLLPNTT